MSLGPESRSIIDDAVGADLPASADKERVRGRLALKLGVAAGVAATTGVKAASAAAGGGGTAALALKLFGIFGGIAAIGAGVYVFQNDKSAERAVVPPTPTTLSAGPGVATTPPQGAPVAQPPAPEPTDDAPKAAGSASVSTLSPAAPSARRAVVAPTASAPAASAPVLPTAAPEGEAALIERAERAIAAGDGLTALGALDAHRRLHREGKLADQREALEPVALCTTARSSTAREAAERYLAAHPRSSQADRIRRVCGLP